MIYGELPLRPIAPGNLDMPFTGFWILTNGCDGGRGPDIEFECVRIELEPIGELQSGCIDRPGRREPKRSISQEVDFRDKKSQTIDKAYDRTLFKTRISFEERKKRLVDTLTHWIM